MKILYFILPIFFIIASCSVNDLDFVTIEGKVQRAINGNGIANQSVNVMTRKSTGSGMFSTTRVLDEKKVITDENGKFSVRLVTDAGAFITVTYQGDEDYYGSGIYRNYFMDEPLIIETDKFVKFKILVKNTNSFDENDFIKIDFFAGLSNVVRTGIENFGVENTYHPAEQLPGGGGFSAYEETSWTGMDVNSIVYYSVRETSEDFKLRWQIKKNGIETDGFTADIPFNINEINPFSFEY
ncbi:Ig-like domain-containing protein [Gelidibacter pelagius]|uniref:Ig-like domain-containing protein n=1 Tax=Gelidibacter pelagius TaxID=2819985 RepID=A0ABS3SWE4_9FLAO|nr:Ig-like domain-containing protein [Gelidibacter pelagius]MBO3100017.1 Ig-like domain-containing protein [Gelidibacter pelagius]